MTLTSPKNPLLQDIRQAAAAGTPTESGLVVAEGPHLLEEALRGGCWTLEQVVTTAEGRLRFSHLLDRTHAKVIEVSERAFRTLSAVEHSQGLLALLKPPHCRWEDLLPGQPPGLLLVLDGIQDPGNAGTMIRSAEAFGAAGFVLLKGSVRSTNGKFLRAAAGSLFRLPFLENLSQQELLTALRGRNLKLHALSASGKQDLQQTDFTGNCALVVGSEALGVSPTLMDQAIAVRIPTQNVESLNAAVACSIALFEASRQRMKA